MKTEFKAKFLQHLNQKKQEKGFTLIELLVVVIIIGILAAVALPSLLSQTNKAKQAEARQNVGAMNRAQQARYMEAGGFTTDMTTLGIGIKTQTQNFIYSITSSNTGVIVNNRASQISPSLKSYVGTVGTQQAGSAGSTEALTIAILCESKNPGQAPVDNTSATSCPANFIVLQ